jgi:hypothetical protein
MRWTIPVLCGLLVTGAAAADEPTHAPGQESHTLKERLGDKASDEQRVDNCGVPPEKRGTKPRPDCAPRESTASAGSSQESERPGGKAPPAAPVR